MGNKINMKIKINEETLLKLYFKLVLLFTVSLFIPPVLTKSFSGYSLLGWLLSVALTIVARPIHELGHYITAKIYGLEPSFKINGGLWQVTTRIEPTIIQDFIIAFYGVWAGVLSGAIISYIIKIFNPLFPVDTVFSGFLFIYLFLCIYDLGKMFTYTYLTKKVLR